MCGVSGSECQISLDELSEFLFALESVHTWRRTRIKYDVLGEKRQPLVPGLLVPILTVPVPEFFDFNTPDFEAL
jgi:hypothetical protein